MTVCTAFPSLLIEISQESCNFVQRSGMSVPLGPWKLFRSSSGRGAKRGTIRSSSSRRANAIECRFKEKKLHRRRRLIAILNECENMQSFFRKQSPAAINNFNKYCSCIQQQNSLKKQSDPLGREGSLWAFFYVVTHSGAC